jgi:hypothetical protein
MPHDGFIALHSAARRNVAKTFRQKENIRNLEVSDVLIWQYTVLYYNSQSIKHSMLESI